MYFYFFFRVIYVSIYILPFFPYRNTFFEPWTFFNKWTFFRTLNILFWKCMNIFCFEPVNTFQKYVIFSNTWTFFFKQVNLFTKNTWFSCKTAKKIWTHEYFVSNPREIAFSDTRIFWNPWAFFLYVTNMFFKREQFFEYAWNKFHG